jgi:hypothetical protein
MQTDLQQLMENQKSDFTYPLRWPTEGTFHRNALVTTKKIIGAIKRDSHFMVESPYCRNRPWDGGITWKDTNGKHSLLLFLVKALVFAAQ